MASDKLLKVSMNLSKSSLRNIDELGELINENNRTRVVSSALEVAKVIMKQVADEKSIVIRHSDGSEQSITFVVT